MHELGKPLEEHGPGVKRFLGAVRVANALLLSTAAYHGTLAGVTKNALDFTQFMAHDEKHSFDNKVVGLIAAAGGASARDNTIAAMVHIVHALRGTVAPLTVTVPQVWKRTSGDGDVTDED